jgi:cbb3-type cytochrome oxidase maturation protein
MRSAAPRPAKRSPTSSRSTLWRKHWLIERNSILLLLGILIVIAIGGLVEVVPLFYLKSTIESAPGMRIMNVLIYLVPLALMLGLTGLVAFLWSLKSGQYDDLDGLPAPADSAWLAPLVRYLELMDNP